MRRVTVLWLGAALLAQTGCSAQGQSGLEKGRQAGVKFHPVKPVVRQQGANTRDGGNLQIGSGRFFSYALPQGWRVGEDGQFALTLVAPDNKALTVMVGNAGMFPGYDPGRFVWEKLSALRSQNLQLGQPRGTRPVRGFQQAVEYEFTYTAGGIGFRGLAKCNVVNSYDTAVMAMTAALSEDSQWTDYKRWLPQVADQISATNGAAFGVRGVMAQNLRNSMEFAEAARNYREWSQHTWQQVTDQRTASTDRQNQVFRETLGNVQPFSHPWGETYNVELPLTYRHYWMNQAGNVVGTDDPTANPNQGSTTEWRQMKRTR